MNALKNIGIAGAVSVLAASNAMAAITLDLTQPTTDVSNGGAAIIGVCVVMLGIRFLRRLIG
jgi:hypothetical protein